MDNSHSITVWLDQLKANSSKSRAAGELWQRYVERLVRLARRKLRGMPRRVADEEDVVLSAFEGFLRRREKAQKRGAGHVRGESIFEQGSGLTDRSGVEPGLHQVAADEPAAAFAAEMAEQSRYLLDQLGDNVQRQIARGKLEGKTNAELAQSLGIGLRSVERKLGIIRRKWTAELS